MCVRACVIVWCKRGKRRLCLTPEIPFNLCKKEHLYTSAFPITARVFSGLDRVHLKQRATKAGHALQ